MPVSRSPPASTVNLNNSIVAGNTGTNISGALASNTFNLIGGDPKLEPLADNGGPTLTHKPLPNSPVIDAGKIFAGLNTDQRGQSRPFNSPAVANATGSDGSDIGSVEFIDTRAALASTSDSVQFRNGRPGYVGTNRSPGA